MEDKIFFYQSKYIKEMLKKFGLEDSKPTKTPMLTEIKLTNDNEADSVDSSKYQGIDEVFSIWKAFGGNTHDLGSFREETDKTTDLPQRLSRLCSQRLETASPDLHDAVTTQFLTASQPFMTALARTTQPKI
ncbi:hypothetical protein Tco_0049381 [Tanacetum coccineum]